MIISVNKTDKSLCVDGIYILVGGVSEYIVCNVSGGSVVEEVKAEKGQMNMGRGQDASLTR